MSLRGPLVGTRLFATVVLLRHANDAEKALERDYFMTAAEAVEFGIVDRIVERRTKDEPDETTDAKPAEVQEGDAQPSGGK